LSSYFKDGKFSDFTIICDGKEYHVHRCFIAPQSKYFERAFTGMFKEGAERKIELKEDLVSMTFSTTSITTPTTYCSRYQQARRYRQAKNNPSQIQTSMLFASM
jgi:hypothetical protein